MDPLTNEIIDLLRRHQRPPTLARLAKSLGISKSRIHQAIGQLRTLGYTFTIDDHHRLSLATAPDRMIDVEIRAGLKTRSFARRLHCYRRIRSTNITAVDLAEAGATEGTVVVSEEQTQGRGRLGRRWHSAPGKGIWSSVILRPRIPPVQAGGLSLLAALAFAQTVESELGIEAELKWPNDGLIRGRKICGVLVEISAEVDRVHYAICGTGINVAQELKDFPPRLRRTAGSLVLAAGHRVDRLAFYRAFLLQFESAYRQFRRQGLEPLLPEYRDRSCLLGKKVTIRQGQKKISGTATAIDESGALVLRSGKKNIVVRSGEATLRA